LRTSTREGATSPLKPAPTARWNDRRLIFGAIVLALSTFFIDLSFPVGLSIGPLYGVVVLIGMFVRAPAFPLWAAAGTSVLTAADVFLSPGTGHAAFGLVNRCLTVTGLWVAAWLVTQYASAGRALHRSMKDLADTNYAIDQAAILAITDVKGRITYANDKFCEISKYSRDELIGQDHRIINSAYHPKEFIRTLWQTIATGRIWHGEIRNRAKDGTYYWVDTTIVPFLDEHAKPYQYMAIRYDISERKRSETRLREQAALARLGQMAAVVAHELKNPLAGIRGALQVIGGRLPDTGREREIVGEILTRLDSLNDIIQDLLVFARPRELKLAPVAIADVLEQTAALLIKDASHGAVTVRITGARPTIEADAELMTIVFLNLLLNAVQASDRGGEVDVRLESRGDECLVRIADRGPGIPADVRNRVFEPFFTTKHRGTGLGLPTAHRVVERHGGTIDIECPAGGGTIVTIALPVAGGAEAARAG
jgi:PAS domain S-box-containing protein